MTVKCRTVRFKLPGAGPARGRGGWQCRTVRSSSSCCPCPLPAVLGFPMMMCFGSSGSLLLSAAAVSFEEVQSLARPDPTVRPHSPGRTVTAGHRDCDAGARPKK
eukprot:767955-Hanusia_phi.AAC.14